MELRTNYDKKNTTEFINKRVFLKIQETLYERYIIQVETFCGMTTVRLNRTLRSGRRKEVQAKFTLAIRRTTDRHAFHAELLTRRGM